MPTQPHTLYDPNVPVRGLRLVGSEDAIPVGAFRRYVGVARESLGILEARPGSTLVTASAAISLTRFNDVRFQATAAGTLLRAGSSILTGMDGNRLTFLMMPPSLEPDLTATAIADYLFVTGGGLLRKVDTAGTVTNWGIAKPTSDPTAAAVAQKSKQIDPLDSQATWSGTNATLADESTILQEGTNSLKMTVAKNTVGSASKAIATDLTQFSVAGDTTDEDYIQVWARVDNPANLEYLQIVFDIDGGDFADDYYTRLIFAAEIPDISEHLSIKTKKGLASDPRVTDQESIFVGNAVAGTVSRETADDILNGLGQVAIRDGQDEWVRLRVPKRSFIRAGGNTAKGWADVAAVKLTAKTSNRGSAIVYWDDLSMVGGGPMIGTYKYKVTFRNTATGHRSNANAGTVTVEDLERQSVTLSSVPTSSDSQVDQREIWRTVGNGTLYFKIGTIDDNTTTTFTDEVVDFALMDLAGGFDVLTSTQLPTDNTPPAATYDDVVGPHEGRAWWCRDSAVGAKGRLYYSPIGRPEGVDAFITVTDDDDPTQKSVIWDRSLYVFTETRIFRILGSDEPFQPVAVFGAPGTTLWGTIVPTPFGILYEAKDGIRLFDGAVSRLISEALGQLFEGRAIATYAAFEGITATATPNEYLISDGNVTLGFSPEFGWRDLGVGCTALHYEPDSKALIGSVGNKVLVLEVEGQTDDNGTAITFEIQPPTLRTGSNLDAAVQRLYVEADTGGDPVSVDMILDGSVVALPDLILNGRGTQEYSINRKATRATVRIGGSLTKALRIYHIEVDVYVP
jgi:hypothetical protein